MHVLSFDLVSIVRNVTVGLWAKHMLKGLRILAIRFQVPLIYRICLLGSFAVVDIQERSITFSI